MVDVYHVINIVIIVYNVVMDPMKRIAVNKKNEQETTILDIVFIFIF